MSPSAAPSVRPSLPRRLRHFGESALLVPVGAALLRLPEGAARRLGRVLGGMIYRFDGRHRRVAYANLELALPGLEEAERTRLVRQSYHNLAATFVDSLLFARRSGEELLERFDCEGWEHLDEAEARGRGVLLMTAHLGRWEAAGHYLALRGRPLTAVARVMDNPVLERHVRRSRERFGNRLLPKRGSTLQMMKELKAGGRVTLMIDQRVHPNEGKAYRFFGQPAYTSPLLASLSIRTGAPVVPFYGIPEADGRRCRVVLRPPILPVGEGPAAVDEMTLTYLEAIEEEIRRHPGLWLWMHRRWRKNPTTIFKKRIPKTAAGPDSTEVVGRR